MYLKHVEIQNFRKLRSCRIDIAETETIFVGANNSGKTSAMNALMLFLIQSDRKEISTTDFTLSNWNGINAIGREWIEREAKDLTLNLEDFAPYLPAVDFWLYVEDGEIHHVSHLIPTLDWKGGLMGVRLRFEPVDIEALYKAYRTAFQAAKLVLDQSEGKVLRLWPESLQGFLDRNLGSFFRVRGYILDPSRLKEPENGLACCQDLPPEALPLESEPFDGLFKIDLIDAQRGFSDAKTPDGILQGRKNLSSQLRQYFYKHLDPTEIPDVEDIGALSAIEDARTKFDEKLAESFAAAIQELEGMGYPGFSDPKIMLTSKISPVDGLIHDAAVQFDVSGDADSQPLRLPEKHNGLGFQNLLSMVFSLMAFRDAWMRRGKAKKHSEVNEKPIEPVHLVLIEEPEAHLHPQVQQVFMRRAYKVLRKHENLESNVKLRTQLVVSTHSSHLAHEVDFSTLRYFRRQKASKSSEVPSATVVNLSETFGVGDETSKFVSRYLKSTHCELFFADAAILVEGPAERMLIPHFIRHQYPSLFSCYVTLLEIGGSHAHRFRPLLEKLGLMTLIITDIDTIDKDTNAKVRPEPSRSQRTSNSTLKDWIPCLESFDDLMSATDAQKVDEASQARVAYQTECRSTIERGTLSIFPYTFEDALVFENREVFSRMNKPIGLTSKMVQALSNGEASEIAEAMFQALKGGEKAAMALDVLFSIDPKTLRIPQYISEGLSWLDGSLRLLADEFLRPDNGVGA